MKKQTITQLMRYRLSLINYAKKNGVTKTAIKYNTNRQYVYRWIKRYDGDIRSLSNLSTKPHSHPKAHTEDEIKLIKDMRRRNPNTGLIVFWVKLKQRGYNHRPEVLYRVMKKLDMFPKTTNKKKSKKKIKPYVQMTYPGERIQVDIKFVPSECLVGNEKLYQYTAIDEYSRFRYIQIYNERSTYISTIFMQEVINFFPFDIKCVRTDNGLEFTNRLVSDKPTLFETYLKQCGINHDLIKPYTPKHNGKVERSHRKDSERFYKNRRFISLEDARKQARRYLCEYNKFPMAPLGWKSPSDYLRDFQSRQN